MNPTILIAVALALTTLRAVAGETKSPVSAYDTLVTAHLFAFGGVGVAGTITGEEKAFRAIVNQADPVAAFQKLLRDGTPEGRMYALVGLRHLDPEKFEAVLPAFLKDSTEIHTASGCMLMGYPAKNLAADIQADKYKWAFTNKRE